MKKKPLIITIISIVCLVICLIAASIFMRPRVTGVKSLVKANTIAQSKVKSYHMDGKVNMDITLDYEELESILSIFDPKLAVVMNLSVDSGPGFAHVITDAGVSIFGQTSTVQTSELYLDVKNMTVYSRTGDSQQWNKSGSQEDQSETTDPQQSEKAEKQADQIGTTELVEGILLVGKTVLENVVYSETDEFYTLTMPAGKAGDLVKDLDLLDRVDLGIADISDITVDGGQIIYNVDKETRRVSSVEFRDVECRGKGTYEDYSVNLKFTINGTFSFSRYNELEESEYAIPAEITEAS